MKRGAKANRNNRIVPVAEIAFRLGISEDTARRDMKSAIRKLKDLGAFEIILASIHAVSEDEHPPLQAESVECRPRFAELYGE